ncbi:MAG: membrane protein insertase YidC [Holophagaceae bacterium]|nr:membrane protein insertase YidC [Holophagaceae bacterium]
MEIWSMWTQFLQASLGFLSAHFGLSEPVSIITLTVVARMALMPLSVAAVYRSQKSKEAMERLKPQLETLRETYKDDPSELAARTMALQRANGISFFGKVSVLNMGTQGIFGLGVFQGLKQTVFSSRFLWITTLAKPDVALTLLIGALMLLTPALMPGATANTSMLVMLAIPVLVSLFFIASLPSTIGLYWATSNALTLVQTLALRSLLARKRSPLAA